MNCCSSAETGDAPLGNWYFPNGTEVPPDSRGWNFSITRGPGVVQLHRRTGGVSGIYRCVIPDQSGVNQTLYVGLYAITSITSGKQNKMHALFMSDRKHYPCFVLSFQYTRISNSLIIQFFAVGNYYVSTIVCSMLQYINMLHITFQVSVI